MKTIQNAFTKIICLMLISTFFVSCSKDDEVVTTPIDNEVVTKPIDNEIVTTPIDNTLAFKGSFVNSVHPTSGNVTINKEKTKLNFTDFK